MSSVKRTSRKTTALLVIIAMLVSVFSVMGMTAEEAHAAAKAKKPAKVTGFKVTQKSEAVTASWKKAKKVKVGKKKYAVKYQLETTVNDIFGGQKTTKSVLSKTKKSYTNHPGTKYTFRVRAFYTKNGKKVYGKWTAKKSQTVKNTMNIKVEAARVNADDDRILAQAHVWGTKASKYDTVVFQFNGQTKKCGVYDYVMFNDAKGGTIKAYAQYTAKNSKGKTKVIKTKTVTCSVKAKNAKDPTTETNPDPGKSVDYTSANTIEEASVSNPYIQEDFSTIGNEKYFDFGPFGNTPAGRAYNIFTVQFDDNVTKAKCDWYFYPADNKVLVDTLSLSGNDAKSPVIYEMTESEFSNRCWGDPKTIVMMKTNWQCIDGYIVGFDKSTKKEVYCKKLGWTTQRGYAPDAPGDVSINGPYYKRCVDIFNRVILKKSEADKQKESWAKAAKVADYLENKTTYEMNSNSLNDLVGIGFPRNKNTQWNGTASYLNPNSFDYSTVLNLMLGTEGGTCYTFQLLESFVAVQIDSRASLDHEDMSDVSYNHRATYAMFSDGTDIILDMSNTTYGDSHVAGTAKDMFYTTSWRDYVKEALGNEACSYWFGF